MATHSSVLAWRIPWTEKPDRLQSMGSHRVGHDGSDLAAAVFYCMVLPSGSVVKNSPASAGDAGLIPELGRTPGEGNGNPLQYSCLENPRDGVAWWAAIYGVAQSRTRLKRLSSSSSIQKMTIKKMQSKTKNSLISLIFYIILFYFHCDLYYFLPHIVLCLLFQRIFR